jgi:hypothetical protein
LKNAYIVFTTSADAVYGCYSLVTHSQVTCLSNNVFCIPWQSLALLDSRQVQYRFANQDDLVNVHPIWNFSEPKPQPD